LIIVPLVPTPLSLRMLGQLCEVIAREGWTDLTLLPFFSLVDRRRSLHQQIIAEARVQFPQMLATEVPYWSEIERLSVRRAPLPASAPSSPAALIYARLWAEIHGQERRARTQCSGGAAMGSAGTLAAAAGNSSTASPAATHASSPPRSGRTCLNPWPRSNLAACAAEASF